jgi:hypothetical protein
MRPSRQALPRQLFAGLLLLASPFASVNASAAEYFDSIGPVIAGQLFVSPLISRDTANAAAGATGGRLGATSGLPGLFGVPPGAYSVFVGFQIPTELGYSLSGVSITGVAGGFVSDGWGVTFHDIADTTLLPAAGESWSWPQHTDQIAQLASDIGSGDIYGSVSQRVVNDGNSHADRFSAAGTDALVANILAKQGDTFYLGVTGGGVNITPIATFVVGDLGLQLFTNEQNVTLVPLPAAGWLFGSALVALVGWKRRRMPFPTSPAVSDPLRSR